MWILDDFFSPSDCIDVDNIDIKGRLRDTTDLVEMTSKAVPGTYTTMIYLNDVEEGGEDLFPALGVTSVPKRGRMLIWKNNEYTTMEHAPVKKGHKRILVRHFIPKLSEDFFVPQYTDVGFKHEKLDTKMYQKLRQYYFMNRHKNGPEGDVHYIDGKTEFFRMEKEMREAISDHVQPLLEEWCGKELVPTIVYAVRTYLDGAVLDMHQDRNSDYAVSASITIYQDVDEDWALSIEDHSGETHSMIMDCGDIVFFEGRNLFHGRPEPFKGRTYVNMYCHYIPKELQ